MDEKSRTASGWGLATVHRTAGVLDAWFPDPVVGTPAPAAPPAELLQARHVDDLRQTTADVVRVEIDLDAPPRGVADAYLRLHLLSHRLVQPHGLNLDGLFGVLPNNAFTSRGPMRPEDVNRVRAVLLGRGEQLIVYGVDRFPRMVDYVVPTGVRIADADRVRLGAHLAVGTTVMHEGFVNFNAGTLGASMVEGRISASVVVGDGSDVGGGASIMGTLSGGGKERIVIGERVLLGANAGVGISIGDDSVVEAGLYVTAGTRIALGGKTVKALELSGVPNLLFRRNSISGAVEALPRAGQTVELNDALHAN